MSDAGYEKSDVDLKKTFIAGFSIVAILVVFLIALNEYFLLVSEKQYEHDVLRPQSLQLREQRLQEQQQLSNYRLIDAKTSIYAIPIDRAMEMISKKGRS